MIFVVSILVSDSVNVSKKAGTPENIHVRLKNREIIAKPNIYFNGGDGKGKKQRVYGYMG
jgi:hypothetical protein